MQRCASEARECRECRECRERRTSVLLQVQALQEAPGKEAPRLGLGSLKQ